MTTFGLQANQLDEDRPTAVDDATDGTVIFATAASLFASALSQTYCFASQCAAPAESAEKKFTRNHLKGAVMRRDFHRCEIDIPITIGRRAVIPVVGSTQNQPS